MGKGNSVSISKGGKTSSVANKKLKKMWRDRYMYLILIPVIAYYLIFCYAPMYGVTIAFKDYNMFKGVFGSEWVGLANFERIFSTSDFYMVLRNTLMLNLLQLLFSFPGPIILALLLNELRSVKFKRVVQTIVYLPHFLSWVVVATLLIPMLSPSTGVINHLITRLGGESIYFMSDPGWWIFIYVAAGVWKSIGWGAIVYLAALAGVDPSLYEAAIIDGANKWQQCIHITIPSIIPTIMVLLILNVGQIMSIGFDQPFLLGNSSVTEVSEVISTYVYRLGLESADISRSTAIGLFQSLVNFVILLITNTVSKKLTGSGIY
ncbi:MAG TPA: sugar ABC transporter permease [Candidatus Gallacutalibacter pullicola]|uniref:Sugar ABC transporter permease n=1 Tax=Candidatus Gallacutalibacter pullicola TaxID=2840830 RepID=A0A9D1J2C4_9FIRM|nr:sugar ABC transporter permease [Candidatus Gallacutalibacter pullicola]